MSTISVTYRCSCPWGGLCRGRCWWRGCWWHCRGSHKGQSQGRCWGNLSKAPRAGTLYTDMGATQRWATFTADIWLRLPALLKTKCTWGPGDSVSMGWGGVGTGWPAIAHRAHWLAGRTQGGWAGRQEVIEGRILQTQPRRHSTCGINTHTHAWMQSLWLIGLVIWIYGVDYTMTSSEKSKF